MSTISETFAAGVPKEFIKPGKFFKLFRTSYAVDVHFFRNGQELPEDALQVEAGFGITVVGGFDRFTITSANVQTVAWFISNGNVNYDRTVGSVIVSEVQGIVTAEDYGDDYAVAFGSTGTGAPLNILAAASNTGGVRVLRAHRYDICTGPAHGISSLLAKATAPASVIDGDMLATRGAEIAFAAGAAPQHGFNVLLDRPLRVASGKRLDFYCNTVLAGAYSGVLYTLLP